MKQASVEAQLFYDPFAAEENQEFLDGAAAFDTILARYKNDEVVHDYTADDFVKDAEALMLDAGFQELEDFDGPIDEGDAAVGHAFLKLIDQLF